jgi:diadenosine tetraphosphate (Ap4A) HIT family hydrolase
MPKSCPFCEVANLDSQKRAWLKSDYGFSVWDVFPLTKGHALVIPYQHTGSFFELPLKVQTDLIALVGRVREELIQEFDIKDVNIGINDGPLAGQTVPHCHIHVIPRRAGDVDDPRGGVRWIIPEKADYWS